MTIQSFSSDSTTNPDTSTSSSDSFSHKNLLLALPTYASISQLSAALVLSSLGASSSSQPTRIATLTSNYVTPVCSPAEANDHTTESRAPSHKPSVHSAIELYEINNEWLLLLVRGLITRRRRFAAELLDWIQGIDSIEHVFTVAGGNAVYRETGFDESNPMAKEWWRELSIPRKQDTDMNQQEETDFIRGDTLRFVSEMKKRHQEDKKGKTPQMHMLVRLCNEGENRIDAHLTAGFILQAWLKSDVKLVEPKAWECLYGNRGSKFLYY